MTSPLTPLVEALKDAAILLRTASHYAPDQAVSDQNGTTGEWLKTRGLSTTLLRMADELESHANFVSSEKTLSSDPCTRTVNEGSNDPSRCSPSSSSGNDKARAMIGRVRDGFSSSTQGYGDLLHVCQLAERFLDRLEADQSATSRNMDDSSTSSAGKKSQGPYRTSEPEEGEPVEVLDSYGMPMDADDIVALLNTYSRLAVADLSSLRSTRRLYIVGLTNTGRRVVLAVYADTEDDAKRKALGRYTGFAVERVVQKDTPAIFRIHDDAWFELVADDQSQYVLQPSTKEKS